MKKALLSGLASIALAATLTLPFGAGAAVAQEACWDNAATLALPLGAGAVVAQEACWDNAAIQAAVASGQIRPVADVLAREGIPASTQVLNVKVCDQGGAPVYVLAVLEASGEARNLTLQAQ